MSLLKSKRKVPNIIKGGRAIPFGDPSDNLYYLQGRSHAKGGIDIGSNPRTGIEAEGGEVVQIKPNELRVLSAQDFIGDGVSPAKQVLAGANPDQVFNEQERFKDRHRLNDDGSKYQDGGVLEDAIDYIKINFNNTKSKIKNIAKSVAEPIMKAGNAGDLGNLINYISGDRNINSGTRIVGKEPIPTGNYRTKNGLYGVTPAPDNSRNHIDLFLYGNEKGFEKYIGKPYVVNGDTLSNKQYKGKIITLDTLDIPLSSKRFIDSMAVNKSVANITNNDPIGAWKDKSIGKSYDNVRNHYFNIKKKGNKYYADVADQYDFDYSILGNIVNNLGEPYTLRQQVPIRFYDDSNINNLGRNIPTKNYLEGVSNKNTRANNFVRDLIKDMEIKRNGGMIATINGNVKNGLISTPRYKCGGRKKAPNGTITDVNTRGVSAPDLWMNTIGQDNTVYDMAANDMVSGNRMAMRHADMREDLGYKSGSGRAIRGSGQVRQYQKDFQNRFWDANRSLHNATDPAGITGDNQFGESNDDVWGEKTNVRTPYGLWSDKNRQMWNDRGFLAADYKGNTVLSGRIADLSKLELPALPKAPTLNAPVGKLDTMPSSTGDNAKSPSSPTNPNPRRGIVWNDDLTSALANGLGSLGSFGAELWGSNLRSWTPYTESPVKLKTNYNINPQLDRIRESSQEAYRDIDANTASSSTALARKQRIRNQAQYAANEQWANKENKETQLINQDKLNLQGVRNRNTNRLNHWAESDANIANRRRQLRGAAWSNLFDNLNKTVQGYIGRRDQRRRDEATERMFNRAYPHGAAMARNIQSRESSGDATIPSLATNPIAITGRLATEKLNDDIIAQTKKRCGGKTKRK